MGKIILGVLLSIGLIYGSVTLVDNLDPLYTDTMDGERASCQQRNRLVPEAEKMNCWGIFSEQARAADKKEMLLGGVIGLVLAGLGWLIAWARIRKRRREAGAATGQ